MCKNFLSSQGWIIFHCMSLSHFVYPVIHRWTPFAYCKECCYEHGYRGASSRPCLEFCQLYTPKVYTPGWNCWIIQLFDFYFLRNLHTACMVQNSWHPHQCRRVPLQPRQHRLLVVLWTRVLLTGVRQRLTVVLICISLMISTTERILMGLLAVSVSSLEKCLFRPSPHC